MGCCTLCTIDSLLFSGIILLDVNLDTEPGIKCLSDVNIKPPFSTVLKAHAKDSYSGSLNPSAPKNIGVIFADLKS